MTPNRPRRAAAALAALVATVMVLSASPEPPAHAASAAVRKADVDRRLGRADARLRAARDREAVLSSEVAEFTGRIRGIEGRLAPLAARRERLDADLAVLDARLSALSARLQAERRRLSAARARLATQRLALGHRLRELYRRDAPDPILVLVQSGSIAAAVRAADTIERAVSLDQDTIRGVELWATEIRAARDRIAVLRFEVLTAERRARAAAERARRAAAALQAERDELDRFRDGRSRLLSRVRGDREALEEETRDLRGRSLRLGRQIARAQGITGATVDVSPSAAGLVWPVNGPLTSGFGMRWGRMHEGIDVGVAMGTPIAAAAGGTVIVAGWAGGYGNLVVVDHGNGLSTAYAHQSRMAVGVGARVGQGTIVGYVGSTGNSTGPHLHFEVRVGGSPVDPLGYL